MNDQVLRFIEYIQPKLKAVKLAFVDKEMICYSNEQIGQIQRLFQMLKSKIYSFDDENFCQYMPRKQKNSIFDQVRSIEISLEDAEMDFLIDWLNDERMDKMPKLMQFAEGGESERKFDLVHDLKQVTEFFLNMCQLSV